MTKFETWQAWCARTGTERLALESTMNQSSHGKAFSFAWDEAVKAERKRICDMLLDMHAEEKNHNYYAYIANIIRESA